MMKATIRDLRYRTKDVLAAVDRGEVVTILYRGKEKARLMPVPVGRDSAEFFPGKAFGMWKDRPEQQDVPGYVRKLRRGRFIDL